MRNTNNLVAHSCVYFVYPFNPSPPANFFCQTHAKQNKTKNLRKKRICVCVYIFPFIKNNLGRKPKPV